MHSVCESIRENYNRVNDFIAGLKKILVKAPSHQVLYQEVTGLSTFHSFLSSQDGVLGHDAQFSCAKPLTKPNALDSTDAAAIKKVQQLVRNKDLQVLA